MAVIEHVPRLSSEAINAAVRRVFRAYERREISRDQCFVEVVRLVYPRVRTALRYAYGVTQESDQNDLFQEVMVRFVRWQGFYDASKPILPWLYSIARHVKLDFLREQKITAHLWRELGAEHEGIPTRRDESTMSVEWKVAIEEALAKLSPDDREVVYLKFYEGFKDQEIANCLSLTLPATKARIRMAVSRLREVLTRLPVRLQNEHDCC
jgi:RNA polymerase sigma-70 factor, ECF subfamily